MKKPKIKKRGGVWYVYREKEKAFQCFDKKTALFCYNVLLLGMERGRKAPSESKNAEDQKIKCCLY